MSHSFATENEGEERDDVAKLVHDLRNPLNTISMNVELLGLLAEETSGELAEGLAALERAVSELEQGLGELDARFARPRRH